MDRRLRIGELARLAGVSPDVLRAWERRYGFLQPERSEGGYRLYSTADGARVRAMVRHLEAGIPAGEAARLVLEEAAGEQPQGPPLQGFSAELRDALDRFDDTGAQAALDRSLGALTFEAVAREVILPYLRELGDRWERGEASVAQEHFASNVIRGRLLSLARGWDRGAGPRTVLACAPGEQHDLGLIVFGLALRHLGWAVTYLGADTPIETVAAAARQLQPAAVVVTALDPGRLEPIRAPLAQLGRDHRLLLAGAGADDEFAADVSAEVLHGDPLDAAAQLASSTAPSRHA